MSDQMTLGKLIARLHELSPETNVRLGNPHSYRGYYSNLAFEVGEKKSAIEAALSAEDVKDKVFTGYKGGEYTMHANVPVWIASYGCLGRQLVAINDDGSLVTDLW